MNPDLIISKLRQKLRCWVGSAEEQPHLTVHPLESHRQEQQVAEEHDCFANQVKDERLGEHPQRFPKVCHKPYVGIPSFWKIDVPCCFYSRHKSHDVLPLLQTPEVNFSASFV